MKSMKIRIVAFFVLCVFMFLNAGEGFAQEDPLAELGDGDTGLEDELAWLQAETFENTSVLSTMHIVCLSRV